MKLGTGLATNQIRRRGRPVDVSSMFIPFGYGSPLTQYPLRDTDMRYQVTNGVSIQRASQDWEGSVDQNSRLKHTVFYDATDFQLVYTNGVSAAPLNVRAGLETPSGTYPVMFQGQRDVVIGACGVVVSDPIPVRVAPGGVVWSRTKVSSTSAVSADRTCDNNEGEGAVFGTGDDRTLSGTINSVYVRCYGPSAVLGLTYPVGQPALVIYGDSIVDSNNDGRGKGWAGRITARPVIKSGVDGDTVDVFNSRQVRMPLRAGAQVAICAFGINNLTGGDSLAALQAKLAAFWTELRNAGVKVYQTTITPKSSSIDGWATVANQTTDGINATRATLNDWIRTRPAPLSGYIELADAVESTRNSGLWKAGSLTNDGVHPVDAGHILLAAAADAAFSTI
ncbi:SGNH/GDSL hydrolase family protein [Gemmata sp. JC717]|uniref:SGNH/GDSL hydrolase family protein n=1 Tax=Gemmata algarum TaxID=2975278 RepID=UPI0021BB77E4|nr:SGNH/GDSL hydrolase family protein [Gemmata algarum]MDY3554751.1 SGNH/GDSL hydrolase family protein [Gemmata algarum]